MPKAGIDLASGTGNTTLITTAAGEHFWCDSLTLSPDAAGEIEVLSGSTVIWHIPDAAAGGQYTAPHVLESIAVGDNLVVNRVDAMALGGAIAYRIK